MKCPKCGEEMEKKREKLYFTLWQCSKCKNVEVQ
jgi:ribosomal protein L37AE/L43A